MQEKFNFNFCTFNAFIKEGSTLQEILQIEVEQTKNLVLKDLFPYSFAIHHASMNPADRTLIEDLFPERHNQVLASTSTVTLACNVLGRAGCPQHDTCGQGILITSHSQLQYYLSLMKQQSNDLNADVGFEPQLYGVSNESLLVDKYLFQRCLDLIHFTAIQLDTSHLIHYDRKTGSFQITEHGRIASHYYYIIN
ncbi:unnamed protein product [Rotaria socialis]